MTTAVDAGSAGAQTFGDFRHHVIEKAGTRVLAYLNIADHGMVSPLVGELEDARWASPERTVAVANEHRDVIVGVKVRLGRPIVGPDPEPALLAARAAADRLELPLMVHVADLPRPIDWLLSRLGEGDIVTHCFHARPEGTLFDESRRVLPGVLAARRARRHLRRRPWGGQLRLSPRRGGARAGLLAGHGLERPPHLQRGRPVHDQVTTLSKLLAVGMPLPALIAATTANPAGVLRRADELGSLAPGRTADVTILELVQGTRELVDAEQGRLTVAEWLEPRWVVRAGVATEIGSGYAAPSNSSA